MKRALAIAVLALVSCKNPATGTECLTEGVAWHTSGAEIQAPDRYAVLPCRTFELYQAKAQTQCSGALPAQVALELTKAIADADLKPGGEVVGKNELPVDGTVLFVRAGQGSVGIGSCARPDCSDLPAELTKLKAVLEKVAKKGLELPSCVPGRRRIDQGRPRDLTE